MRAFETDFIFEAFVHIGRYVCIYMVDYKYTTKDCKKVHRSSQLAHLNSITQLNVVYLKYN